VVSGKGAQPPGGPDHGGRVSTPDGGGGAARRRSLDGSLATPYTVDDGFLCRDIGAQTTAAARSSNPDEIASRTYKIDVFR
jgi:hypothetical protein